VGVDSNRCTHAMPCCVPFCRMPCCRRPSAPT
jgi:hypothetical protein